MVGAKGGDFEMDAQYQLLRIVCRESKALEWVPYAVIKQKCRDSTRNLVVTIITLLLSLATLLLTVAEDIQLLL